MDYKEQIEKGEAFFLNGSVQEAETIFASVLEKSPKNYYAINNLGVIQHNKGELKNAEQSFLKAYSLKQDYMAPLRNLVDIYKSESRWKDAVEKLIRCITIEPENTDLFNQLGMIYIEMSDMINAVKALQKSLALNTKQNDIREIFNSLRKQISYELSTLKYNKKNEQQHKSLNESNRASNIVKKSFPPISSTHKTNPVVTVGLPVFNGGEILYQAIESILSQEYQNIELIISDNCSTDNTKEICLKYKKLDQRVKYYRLEENLGAIKNFTNVLGLSDTPYFMWASHDDLREPAFINKCLEKLEEDSSIALVYPMTKVLDKNSSFKGIANDHVNADQENPVERFNHLIWELGMCNMFYGLYRSKLLKKLKSWDMALFFDNLLLAELSLLGKIVQIDDTFFIRRLTRNYDYKSPEDRNAELIKDLDGQKFNEGITLPHCRLAYAHLELINNARFKEQEKIFLIDNIINCFRTRFGRNMEYEINRAIKLINAGFYFQSWNQKQTHSFTPGKTNRLDYFHINNLLKHLKEALFIYPERSDLKEVFETCLIKITEFQSSIA